MSMEGEWMEFPGNRNIRRNFYYQGNRNQQFPRPNYNNRNFMSPGFMNNFCDVPNFQPNYRPYRREFNNRKMNLNRGMNLNQEMKNFQSSFGGRRDRQNNSNRKQEWLENDFYVSGDFKRSGSTGGRCLTPGPSGSQRGCLKKVPSIDDIEELTNTRSVPTPSIPLRGCLKKARSSGNLVESYTKAPNKMEKVWTDADSMDVDEMDIETSKEAIYESDEEVNLPKITGKDKQLVQLIWNDSDDEETKDVGRRSLLKYNVDTLPNYDPNVPVGDEGVFELKIYRCTFCNILCLDKEKLRVHMISKYHYEKYKKYIELLDRSAIVNGIIYKKLSEKFTRIYHESRTADHNSQSPPQLSPDTTSTGQMAYYKVQNIKSLSNLTKWMTFLTICTSILSILNTLPI